MKWTGHHNPRFTSDNVPYGNRRRLLIRFILSQAWLLPVLIQWKLQTGGEGRVIPPMRYDGEKVDIHHTPGTHLRRTLKRLGLALPGLGSYEATRHTSASQWVLSGGSIEKLSKALRDIPDLRHSVYGARAGQDRTRSRCDYPQRP